MQMRYFDASTTGRFRTVDQLSRECFPEATNSAGSDARLGAALFEPIFLLNRRNMFTVVIPGFEASQSNSAPISIAK